MLIEEIVYKLGRIAWYDGKDYKDYPPNLSPVEKELWQYGYDEACSEDTSLGSFNN